MKTGYWKTVVFTVAILAVGALLIVAGAKAAELGSFSRHHHEYHTAAFRFASAAQHLR
jgi:hypothetical protein